MVGNKKESNNQKTNGKDKEKVDPWHEFNCYLGNHENNNAFDDYGRPIK